jgi:hypothetical protein
MNIIKKNGSFFRLSSFFPTRSYYRSEAQGGHRYISATVVRRREQIEIKRQRLSPKSGRHVTFHVINHRGIGTTVAPAVLIDLNLTRRIHSSDNGYRTPGTTEGLNGRAEIARGGVDGERRRCHGRHACDHLSRYKREVGLGLGATECTCSCIVRTCGALGRIKGTKPDPRFLNGVAYLSRESAPWSFPDSSEFYIRFSFSHPLRHL